MSTPFPATSLDTTTTLPTESASTPLSTNHVVAHTNLADAVIALETKLGINSSAVTTTHDYKLSEVLSSDKAVGKTATQTLSGKTLTSPVINVGSDATGDIYYRSSGGAFTRLPLGTTLQQIRVNAGATAPEYFTPAAQADSSYAAKGVVQFLTDAATSGVTVASGVANVNFGTGANQIVKLDSSSKLPAVDGSALTGLTNQNIYKNGTTSFSATTASGNIVIAHGCGKTPKNIKITANLASGGSGTGAKQYFSAGVYNGTTNSNINSAFFVNASGYSTNSSDDTYTVYLTDGSAYQRATATFDATNITLAFTYNATLSGTIYLLWEAQA